MLNLFFQQFKKPEYEGRKMELEENKKIDRAEYQRQYYATQKLKKKDQPPKEKKEPESSLKQSSENVKVEVDEQLKNEKQAATEKPEDPQMTKAEIAISDKIFESQKTLWKLEKRIDSMTHQLRTMQDRITNSEYMKNWENVAKNMRMNAGKIEVRSHKYIDKKFEYLMNLLKIYCFISTLAICIFIYSILKIGV